VDDFLLMAYFASNKKTTLGEVRARDWLKMLRV
jgi:hypothetical protein